MHLRDHCHRGVVTPAFRVVSTRVVEGGASESSRPRRDPRVGAQLARQPDLFRRLNFRWLGSYNRRRYRLPVLPLRPKRPKPCTNLVLLGPASLILDYF